MVFGYRRVLLPELIPASAKEYWYRAEPPLDDADTLASFEIQEKQFSRSVEVLRNQDNHPVPIGLKSQRAHLAGSGTADEDAGGDGLYNADDLEYDDEDDEDPPYEDAEDAFSDEEDSYTAVDDDVADVDGDHDTDAGYVDMEDYRDSDAGFSDTDDAIQGFLTAITEATHANSGSPLDSEGITTSSVATAAIEVAVGDLPVTPSDVAGGNSAQASEEGEDAGVISANLM